MATQPEDRPIRIVHYVHALRLELGGVVRAVLDLAACASATGADVTILTQDDHDTPGGWRDSDESPLVLSWQDVVGDGSLTDALAEYDVLHLHGPWEPIHVKLAKAARKIGLPYVVSPHGMLDRWSLAQKRLKKCIYLTLFAGPMLRGAAAIHCTAKAEAEQVAEAVSGLRPTVLPLPVDLTPPSDDEQGKDIDIQQVLFMGRLHYKKGVEHFIDAARLAEEAGIEAAWVIAGEGEPDYKRTLEARADDVSQVLFLGMVTGDDKRELLRRSTCLVLPTHQENFGLVLVEALAAGVPVVTTRGVDIWRELEAAGQAIVDQQPHAIFSAVRRWIDNPAEAAHCAARGRDYVAQSLTPDVLGPQFLIMYRDCAKAGSA